MATVVLDSISKTYNKGKVQALRDISLEVNTGELFGLIGPDGAGKTSAFRILTTLLLPDGGKASVNGHDVIKDYKAIRREVGYMPGRFSLYQDLSVEENLNFFATVFNTTVRENYGFIKEIYAQLEPFKSRSAGKLSGGMKQKLALCCALIHRPSVLFLDEPTTGVDAVSRKEFWEMLQGLKRQGITILVSTPYMDEAALCERIALIQNGSLLSIDKPENMTKSFPEKLFAVKSDNMSALLTDLRQSPLVKSCYAFGAFHHITFREDGAELPGRLAAGLEKRHGHVEVKLIEPTIEDCFIRLMTDRSQPLSSNPS